MIKCYDLANLDYVIKKYFNAYFFKMCFMQLTKYIIYIDQNNDSLSFL